jgi:hypothetical protein
VLLFAEDGVDLGLERRRVERLDELLTPAFFAATTLSVFDSAVTMMKGVRATGDRRRVPRATARNPSSAPYPIGDDEPVVLRPHHVEGRTPIAGLIDIGETELLQEIADDPDHRLVVVDDEHGML